MDSFLNGGWVVRETLLCSVLFDVFFCRNINNLKTNMTSENILVTKHFCLKTHIFQAGFFTCPLFNREKSHRRIDSAGGRPFLHLHRTWATSRWVRKAVEMQRWRRDAKKGVGCWGCSLFEECEILHKLSLPKSKLSVRENIEVERRLS